MTTANIDMQDIVCEFFEIAIHSILYTRNIYPQSIFNKRSKYGVIVYEAEHPQIKEYISESLKSVHFHLKANQLRKFLICISSSNKIIEKYVFDVIQIQNDIGSDPLFLKLEQDFRKFYLQLHTLHIHLKPLPHNSIFTLEVHTTEYSSLAFNENPIYANFPWVQRSGHRLHSNANIVPLHTIDTNNLALQIYIENTI